MCNERNPSCYVRTEGGHHLIRGVSMALRAGKVSKVALSRRQSAYREWGCGYAVDPSGGDRRRKRSRRVALPGQVRHRYGLPPVERLELFASILMTALASPLE